MYVCMYVCKKKWSVSPLVWGRGTTRKGAGLHGGGELAQEQILCVLWLQHLGRKSWQSIRQPPRQPGTALLPQG